MAGGVISPATVFPSSRDDHVNNHLFIGDQPLITVNIPLCQVEAIPRKSEGIEPFTTVNTPPCQVGGTPRKSEGIEPFNTVNTPPCPVEVFPSHPINNPSGHIEDASSPLIPSSGPMESCVPLVNPPSSFWPGTDSIAPVKSSVMSSLCHASPDTTPAPLKTTQATSHEQPVDTPIGSERPRSAFIEEVDDEDAAVMPVNPEPIGHTTVQHVNDPDKVEEPFAPGQPRPCSTGNDPADVLLPDPDNDPIPPLGDPEHEFFGETTLPSISLSGAAAIKRLIDAGEEVYTINIQLISDYQDIEALHAISNTPAPTTALHSEPLPTDEAELFAKVVPEVYQDFFNVFSWEEAKNMPPHHKFDHKIQLEMIRHLRTVTSIHSLALSSASFTNSSMTCLAK